ncbi:MAG: hypothetical protein JXB38_10700 [Anaerolineales bacterium]|nr:hypothetical protein [Anaerolineales bacterium]
MMDANTPKCGDCPMRKKAEANPKSFMARLWKWHTGWCPGWKAYQVWLKENPEAEQPAA